MFGDFDNNLREMGFGDIAVNKKMKVFISAFYGRITNYSRGMDQIKNDQNDEILSQSILNNIYKSKVSDEYYLKFFKQYMINNLEFFNSRELKINIDEKFKFNDFPIEEKNDG